MGPPGGLIRTSLVRSATDQGTWKRMTGSPQDLKGDISMAATPSTMLALGTNAPEFELPDVVSGKVVAAREIAGNMGLLVMFICRHCPYVRHIQSELSRIGKDYSGRNLGIVAISSNDVAVFPDDAPEKLKEMAQELGFSFPYCYDEESADSEGIFGRMHARFFPFR